MAANLSADPATPLQVDALSCLRDWIEHYYKPAKHELGWADDQVRSAAAIERPWHLVMLADPFSLLAGTDPAVDPATEPKADSATARLGGKVRRSTDRLE